MPLPFPPQPEDDDRRLTMVEIARLQAAADERRAGQFADLGDAEPADPGDGLPTIGSIANLPPLAIPITTEELLLLHPVLLDSPRYAAIRARMAWYLEHEPEAPYTQTVIAAAAALDAQAELSRIMNRMTVSYGKAR